MAFKFSNGVWVRDLVTGFAGCIIARTDDLIGCNRYFLQPPAKLDGSHVDGIWLDEPFLEVDTSRQQLRLDRGGAEPPG